MDQIVRRATKQLEQNENDAIVAMKLDAEYYQFLTQTIHMTAMDRLQTSVKEELKQTIQTTQIMTIIIIIIIVIAAAR